MKLLALYRNNRPEFFRVIRYLLAGGWNTLFGIGVYALLFRLFGEAVNYLMLLIPANIIAITGAFLTYKYIVFRTRGDGWGEYFRCYAVYGGAMLAGAAGMFVLVDLAGLPPVAANIVTTFVTVVCSYFGHRFFSFGKGLSNSGQRNGQP